MFMNRRTHILKIYFFLKLIYRSYALPIKIQHIYFLNFQAFLRFIWQCNRPRKTKTIFKKTEPKWNTYIIRYQNLYWKCKRMLYQINQRQKMNEMEQTRFRIRHKQTWLVTNESLQSSCKWIDFSMNWVWLLYEDMCLVNIYGQSLNLTTYLTYKNKSKL